MKKKFLAVLAFTLVLSLVLTVVVAAGDCGPPPPCECPPCEPPPPPPPPPPCAADCSPGFWKNHTELWYNDPLWAGMEVWMLAALRARGNEDLFAYRFEVADWLNAAYPWVDCD